MRLKFSILFLSLFFVPVSAFAKEAPPTPLFIGPAFKTTTKSYVLVDKNTSELLAAKNPYEQRPIASLTKLMTAMVALDDGFDFNGQVTYDPARHYAYRNYMNFKKGDVIANDDLWYSMLVGSMNIPARMIVDSLGITDATFIRQMNSKAIALGIPDMRFVDMHGLSEDNIGSAASIAKMLSEAIKYPEIAEALGTSYYQFDEVKSMDKRVHHQFAHTDTLLTKNLSFDIEASKTGYTSEAGPCIALAINDTNGKQYFYVNLGESDYYRRFREIPKFIAWWHKLSETSKVAVR